MSFTSWIYPIFLLGVVGVYWQLPLRGRWWLLLISSYTFYAAWDARLLALLLTSTTIDYFCGRGIYEERRPLLHVVFAALIPLAWLGVCRCFGPAGQMPLVHGTVDTLSWISAASFPVGFLGLYCVGWRLPSFKRRRFFLWLSVLSNLSVLCFFKYAHFFADSLQSLLGLGGLAAQWTLPQIILPIAISFYTFQSISYAVDLYRGQAEPARDFILFAAYLAFFPQLIAGPIERAKRFLPQFECARVWHLEHLHQGLRLMLLGCFKKLFVADNCALVANPVFDGSLPLHAAWALLGVLAFAFQIYGDFSGYTDLARGSARLLGIELSENFRQPYFARGPSEFWQRWHITLSTWFRDYVYIPLGGNRRGTALTLVNLWVTMLLAGLWHGASWTFLAWGGYHALLLSVYRLWAPLHRLESADAGTPTSRVAMGGMFLLTLGGWALFRCSNLDQLTQWWSALSHWPLSAGVEIARPSAWLAIHVLPLLGWQWATRQTGDESKVDSWAWPVRGMAYLVIALCVASSTASEQEFIYFQF